jgi:drug/metabolite transporter (DMT)-like permease
MTVSTAAGSGAHDNVRGAASMIFAVAMLSLMDACLKVLAPHYSPLQVTALRGLSALPFVAVWVAIDGGFGQLRHVRFPLHVMRAVLGIIMLVTFSFALRRIGLADAYAIFFIAPLLITAMAAVMLRERVDARRWAAIVLGFVTVLMMLRPTGQGALTVAGLAVLVTAIGYALSAITVRVLGRTDSSQSMVFWLMTMIGFGAGLLALPGWRPIQPQHWLVIGALAVTGAVGQWAITEAFRRGEASLVAPFEYTALAWGAGLDWMIWRAVPSRLTLLGAAVIIASGIYLLREERVHVEAEHP